MQKNSEKFSFFVGVDVGKDHLDTALRLEEGDSVEHRFDNTVSGLGELLLWLESHGAVPDSTLICLEHTGVYGEKLCMVGHGAGYKLWKVPAFRIAHIQLGPDRLKSDQADSRKIAEFCQRFHDQVDYYVPDSTEIGHLKQFILLRKQLVEHRQRLLNQQHAHSQTPLGLAEVTALYKQNIQYLSQQIKEVERSMEKLIKQHQSLKRMFDILCSIPGIGPVTARAMIVTTQAFTRINCHKKLAAFAGTAPYENSSGKNAQWKKRRISNRADRDLKTLLTTAVMATIKKGAYFRDYYHILLQKPGRLNMQAINIIRNKLLKIIVTLIKKDELFNKNLFKLNAKSWNQNLLLS